MVFNGKEWRRLACAKGTSNRKHLG